MSQSHFTPNGKHGSEVPVLRERHAHILAESLPFVQAMHGQTVVMAFLGHVLFDPASRQRLVQDVALLALLGMRPVLVQGTMPQFHLASTTKADLLSQEAAMQVTRAAMADVNLAIVRMLNREGVKAVGLNGQDAQCAQIVRDSEGRTRVQVDTSLVALLQANQMVPVLMALASDAEGGDHCVAPEDFAAQLAQKLAANTLLLVSEGDALHRAGIKDGVVGRADLEAWLAKHAQGETAAEVRAALEALKHGIATVHLVDATAPSALVAELLTNEGTGTVLCRRTGPQMLADTARYFMDADCIIKPNFTTERKRVVRF